MQPYLWQFLALTFTGWVNRSQQDAIEYLKEENRVLREQLVARRLRFTDYQRRRLAAKAKALRREGLNEISDSCPPDTLLRWYKESCRIEDSIRCREHLGGMLRYYYHEAA